MPKRKHLAVCLKRLPEPLTKSYKILPKDDQSQMNCKGMVNEPSKERRITLLDTTGRMFHFPYPNNKVVCSQRLQRSIENAQITNGSSTGQTKMKFSRDNVLNDWKLTQGPLDKHKDIKVAENAAVNTQPFVSSDSKNFSIKASPLFEGSNHGISCCEALKKSTKTHRKLKKRYHRSRHLYYGFRLRNSVIRSDAKCLQNRIYQFCKKSKFELRRRTDHQGAKVKSADFTHVFATSKSSKGKNLKVVSSPIVASNVSVIANTTKVLTSNCVNTESDCFCKVPNPSESSLLYTLLGCKTNKSKIPCLSNRNSPKSEKDKNRLASGSPIKVPTGSILSNKTSQPFNATAYSNISVKGLLLSSHTGTSANQFADNSFDTTLHASSVNGSDCRLRTSQPYQGVHRTTSYTSVASHDAETLCCTQRNKKQPADKVANEQFILAPLTTPSTKVFSDIDASQRAAGDLIHTTEGQFKFSQKAKSAEDAHIVEDDVLTKTKLQNIKIGTSHVHEVQKNETTKHFIDLTMDDIDTGEEVPVLVMTKGKAKFLMDELDMLITERELALQKMYSKRAHLKRKIMNEMEIPSPVVDNKHSKALQPIPAPISASSTGSMAESALIPDLFPVSSVTVEADQLTLSSNILYPDSSVSNSGTNGRRNTAIPSPTNLIHGSDSGSQFSYVSENSNYSRKEYKIPESTSVTKAPHSRQGNFNFYKKTMKNGSNIQHVPPLSFESGYRVQGQTSPSTYRNVLNIPRSSVDVQTGTFQQFQATPRLMMCDSRALKSAMHSDEHHRTSSETTNSQAFPQSCRRDIFPEGQNGHTDSHKKLCVGRCMCISCIENNKKNVHKTKLPEKLLSPAQTMSNVLSSRSLRKRQWEQKQGSAALSKVGPFRARNNIRLAEAPQITSCGHSIRSGLHTLHSQDKILLPQEPNGVHVDNTSKGLSHIMPRAPLPGSHQSQGVTLTDNYIAHSCSVCNRPGAFMCAGCQRVFYCSPQCQVHHWPSHHLLCSRMN